MSFKSGKLTIATQIDGGAEKVSSFDAELEIQPLNARIQYVDNGSLVSVQLQKDEVTIERTGEYTFLLRLKEGERLPASLGVLGNVGDLTAYTERLNYSIKTEKSESILLIIKYDLLFASGEKQEMKIRLFAKTR